MISSPYLRTPEYHVRCIVRVINTLHGEGRASFVKTKITFMHQNVVENLDKSEFETAKIWLEACEGINKLMMKDFKLVLISHWWLKLMQLCPSLFDEASYAERLLNYQIQAYLQILKEKGEAEANKFLIAQKVSMDQIKTTAFYISEIMYSAKYFGGFYVNSKPMPK